jgi:hypothetical protein
MTFSLRSPARGDRRGDEAEEELKIDNINLDHESPAHIRVSETELLDRLSTIPPGWVPDTLRDALIAAARRDTFRADLTAARERAESAFSAVFGNMSEIPAVEAASAKVVSLERAVANAQPGIIDANVVESAISEAERKVLASLGAETLPVLTYQAQHDAWLPAGQRFNSDDVGRPPAMLPSDKAALELVESYTRRQAENAALVAQWREIAHRRQTDVLSILGSAAGRAEQGDAIRAEGAEVAAIVSKANSLRAEAGLA